MKKSIVITNSEANIINELLVQMSDGYWEDDDNLNPYWAGTEVEADHLNGILLVVSKDTEYGENPFWKVSWELIFDFFADMLGELLDSYELSPDDIKDGLSVLGMDAVDISVSYKKWREYKEPETDIRIVDSEERTREKTKDALLKICDILDNLTTDDGRLNWIDKGKLHEAINEVREELK